jgi:hypothetical protein
MLEPLPPLVLLAGIVLVFALSGAVAALELGVPPPTTWRPPTLDRQRDLARRVGLGLGAWLGLRAGCAAAGLAAGAVTGIPSLAVGAGVMGFVGVPWLLAGRVSQRRLDMERALAALVLEVQALMRQSNLALDRALREAARHPAPALAWVLAPLAGDAPIGTCLEEVGRRARSPLADLVVTALLLARTHGPGTFVQVAEQVLKPVLELSAEIQEENHATLAQQRAAALAVGAIMVGLLVAVLRVPSMHGFYVSPAGQLVLLSVLAMYVALVWLIGQVARPLGWAAWDLAAVRREAEALVG